LYLNIGYIQVFNECIFPYLTNKKCCDILSAMQEIEDDIHKIVELAIKEDVGSGDITSTLTIEEKHQSEGKIVAKDDGIISGMMVVKHILDHYTSIKYTILRKDGEFAAKGETVIRLKGSTVEILSYERTMLNFLQHLSGIATYTNEFVLKTVNYGCRVLDTRKTLPGMRRLEKKAVKDGGGTNHRMGLYDAVLIKENHIKAAGSISNAVDKVRHSSSYIKIKDNPGFFIQVECETIDQVKEACKMNVDEILLDNMPLPMARRAIAVIRKISPKTSIEISGNVNLKSVVAIARLRPDRISIGKVTHSAPVLDLSLLLDDILIV
jgi:nicotinate-nucleotide pyrophosphorylase (carboxylating)